MSNLIHAMQKKINAAPLTFPTEMYNNLVGSLIVCAFIFGNNKTKEEANRITKRWKNLIHHPEQAGDIDYSQPESIDKTLALFSLTRPVPFSIAFVQSKYNCLFAPFVSGKILPLREDGFSGITLRTGKIYPVTFDAVKESD